jgi:hypothetical protein
MGEEQQVVGAIYQEFCPAEDGMTFYQFCACIHNTKLWSNSVDQIKVLQIFRDVVGAADETLTFKDFRKCIELIGMATFGDRVQQQTIVTRVVTLVAENRDDWFRYDAMPPARDLTYDEDIIEALGSYSMALRALYQFYVDIQKDSEDRRTSARAVWRLCSASGVIPIVVVPTEFVDIAKVVLRKPRPDLVRYLEELEADMNRNERQSYVGAESSGNPHSSAHGGGTVVSYNYAEFVEFMCALVLLAPPSTLEEEVEARVQRLHKVFEELHLLSDSVLEEQNLPALPSWAESVLLQQAQTIASSGLLAEEELNAELEPLPPKPHLKLTNPPPNTEFAPPPPTLEELMQQREEQKAKKKKKAGKAVQEEYMPARWGEIVYYAHRKVPVKPELPEELRTERLGDVWAEYEKSLEPRPPPIVQPAYVMIDEPLVAPECDDDDDITTIMETAQAQRRQRHLSVATQLLCTARAEWVFNATGVVLPGFVQRPPPKVVQDPARESIPITREPKAGRLDFVGATATCALDPEEPSDLTEALDPSVRLYFLLEAASILVTEGDTDGAIALLMRAKEVSLELPLEHPDRALVWCALGRAMHRRGALTIAARCLFEARKLREAHCGPDSVDTATTYHNLAVALLSLSRAQEAVAFLTLADAIFRLFLGHCHPRSRICVHTLQGAKRAQQGRDFPEKPHLFYQPFQATFSKGGKKKKKPKKRA